MQSRDSLRHRPARAPVTGAARAFPAALAVLTALTWAMGGAGPTSGQGADQDSYLDPLAYTRVEAGGESVPVVLVDHAAGQERTLQGRRLLRGSREIYLPSPAVAAIFQAVRFWQGPAGRLDLKIGTQQFGMTGGSRVVTGPGGDMLLPVPVLAYEGDLWLPLAAVHRVIAPQLQKTVSWDPQAARLVLGEAGFNVVGITAEVVGRTTTVSFACTAPLDFTTDSPRPGLVELAVSGGILDPDAAAAAPRVGLLQGITFRQMSGQVLIELEVDQLVGRVRSHTTQDGGEIVLVLEEEQVSALPDPVPRGHSRMNIDVPPSQVPTPIEVQTVVIDPGHGGDDPGAVGPAGTVEKDVNLAVGRELRRYLERRSDVKVVMTRERDAYLEPAARAELANTGGGDLFVSLHCDSWFNDKAQGLQTYFLSPVRGDGTRGAAGAAGAAAAGNGNAVPDDVDFIAWDEVQNRFIAVSGRLAEVLQSRVPRDLGVPDRGVRQAGLRVLAGAYMPAVLVEMGFLSNPAEEARLNDRDYQRRLAQALGEAILAFREQAAAAREAAGAGSGADRRAKEYDDVR